MKIEVTRVSTSKKETVWIQAKILCSMTAEDVVCGGVYDVALNEEETATQSEEEKK
jgi:hypothetical protein